MPACPRPAPRSLPVASIQAKGVLMARHAITADRAFEVLVLRSQHTNTKLRDVARDLLKSVTEETGSPGR